MSADYLTISNGQLLLAMLLMAVNFAISVAFRLGLGRLLLIASLRMVVQLLLIGFVLEWLFSQQNPWVILAIGLVMAGVAGYSAVGRSRRRFVGIYWSSILSVLVTGAIVMGWGLGVTVPVEPWYDPQYFIPMLGMVLGNMLTGMSLGLDRFMDGLVGQQAQIEALLSLGADRWEAGRRLMQESVRTGMIPILNSMMVMGLVSLPGMMTGQILAGASPIDAVRYQIVITFMIASATALGTFGVVLLAFNRLLSPDHRLRLDRLRNP